MRTPCLLVLLTLLANCGGNSKPTTSIQPTVDESVDDIIMVDEEIKTEQATDIVLYYPSKTLTDISWQQSAGPADVELLAKHSKVIAFTPKIAGNYSFIASFKINGIAQSVNKTVNVSTDLSMINARLGHSVLEGNKVSLRASSHSTVNNVNWRQISGPTVSLTNYRTNDLAIFFTAPQVTHDELIIFEVSGSINGNSYRDRVAVLVENASNISANAYFEQRVANVQPYRVDSPYAEQLVDCVYSNKLTNSCTLARLPLIAQDSAEPTLDDIMNRVVVSHQWMGARFEQFLQNFDPHNDFKNLLRATSAIVIAYDIRPSFYWAATGAIYLDANNFWLTPNERDTINEAPDYRSAFGNELNFVMPWRYVNNNAYASQYFAPTDRVHRSEQQALYRLASLLYHELAHANDFFPSSEWYSHNATSRILDAALSTDFESDQLAILYPLNSQVMRNLAQVSFHGTTASNTEQAYLPDDVATHFKVTGANDYYNFSSLREDYAMLFEELMMASRYQLQRDVAVTNNPTGSVVYANDYIVAWGERGRIAKAQITPRVSFVAKRVLPEFNVEQAIAALPEAQLMIAGNDWVQNLNLSAPFAPSNAVNGLVNGNSKMPINERRAPEQRDYGHKILPKH